LSKTDNKTLFVLIICSGLLLIIFVFMYSPGGETLYTVQYGEIRDEFTAEAVFIRDEEIVNSPASGEVKLLVPEGQRVRSGSTVATVGPGEEEVYAYQSGVISFKNDGSESFFRPGDWSYLNRELLEETENDFSTLRSGQEVQTGQELFRVVNNFSLHLAILYPPEEPLPGEDSIIRVEFPRLDGEIYRGQLVHTVFTDGIIILKMRQFVDEFLSLRTQPVHIIRGIYRGTLVPRESLVQTEEGTAVLIPGRDKPVLRRVEVIGGNDRLVQVEGLSPGDEIFLQPDIP